MITTILGLMNSGKTLMMTRELYKAYRRGKRIITNYNVAFPHEEINRDFLIYLGENAISLKNVAIGLDELWIWMDSRKSQMNSVLSYFFNQSSKDDSDIFITAQWNQQIDIRLRQNQHKIIQCARTLKIENKYLQIPEEKRFLTLKQQKLLYIKCVHFKRINMGMFSDLVPSKIEYVKASPIFKLYNTTEKIGNK